MPRNAASRANKQRRRPPGTSDSTRIPKAQSGHQDPSLRLDGQKIDKSFSDIDGKDNSKPVVGIPGWKTPDGQQTRTIQTSSSHEIKCNYDDVWTHFWGDTRRTTDQIPPKSISPNPSRSSTPSIHT